MTINIRTLQSLPENFLNEHPDLEAVSLADRADINGDGQLGEVSVPTNTEGETLQFNELEYLLYLQRAQERSNSSSYSSAQRASYAQIAVGGEESPRSFLTEKRAGRLNTIASDATAWEQRLDQALSGIRLSLTVYNTFPRTFRDHIAPNYFRSLAQAVVLDTNSNGEVTVQEITDASIHNRDELAETRFNRIDANHDGNINLEEFRAHVRSQGIDPHAEEVQDAFGQSDADHQNGISLEEYKRGGPTDAALRREAQNLIVSASQEMRQAQARLGSTMSEESEVDRLSSRLSVFDLSYIDPARLTTDVLQENNIFRILNWMKTLCPNQSFINSERVDELLKERALDMRPLMGNIERLCAASTQMATRLSSAPAPAGGNNNENQTRATEIRRNVALLTSFRERFNSISSHHILTEAALTQILASPLALNEIKTAIESLINNIIPSNSPENAQYQQSFRAHLQALLHLAGADSTLTREDLTALLTKDRMRVILLMTPHSPRFSNEDAVSEALTVVAQEFVADRIPGGNEGIFRRIREEGSRKGLSSSTIDHIITHIREEMRKTTLGVDERPHFLEALWQGFAETQIENPDYAVYPLSSGERVTRIEGNQFLARALIHYTYLHPDNTLEIVQRTERNELFFLIEHVIAGGIRDRARAHAGDGAHGAFHYLSYLAFNPLTHRPWRQRGVDNAEAQHRVRLQAVQALRTRLEGGNGDINLAAAVAGLQNEEQRRILTDELHVQELERIYYIPNSAEQEIAFTRFATYTLRDQVNPERGILSAFRKRFGVTNIHTPRDLVFNQWQLRNAPAAATIDDRIIRYSEHTDIRNQAIADRFDLRGNGGDLSPLHWGVEFSDDEASLDGISDVIMQQLMITGFIAGSVGVLRSTLGMGGFLNRAITGVEFMLAWKNHTNPIARFFYWPARAVSEILSIPLHRELSSEMNLVNRGVVTSEVDMRMANVIANVQRTSWNNRLGGFFWNQAANLQANGLLFNRNTQTAAANLLRLSQTMLRVSEERFVMAERLLGEARTASRAGGITSQKLTEIEGMLARAADQSRQGHALRELAITQQSSIGLNTQASVASESLARALTQAEGIPTMVRSTSGIANLDGRIAIIETHLAHLTTTGQRIQGLSVYQRQLASRGALAGAGLYGLAALAENRAAAQAAAQMVNPAAIIAQNPAMQGQWQLYFLGWKMLHDQTLSAEYRNNPTLREWALEQGINTGEISQEVLQQAYESQQGYRGSRMVYRNAFLNPLREADEREPVRGENLTFPDPNGIRSNESGTP